MEPCLQNSQLGEGDNTHARAHTPGPPRRLLPLGQASAGPLRWRLKQQQHLPPPRLQNGADANNDWQEGNGRGIIALLPWGRGKGEGGGDTPTHPPTPNCRNLIHMIFALLYFFQPDPLGLCLLCCRLLEWKYFWREKSLVVLESVLYPSRECNTFDECKVKQLFGFSTIGTLVFFLW